MKKVILFASGSGTNVKAILQYFKNNKKVNFPLIVTNNPQAGVIHIAQEYGIDVLLLSKNIFLDPIFIDTIDYHKPDLIVLAGFLWKIPEYMVSAYQDKIVNIHPSLLPAYGGKGMYGMHVHNAVIQAGKKESGITIHLVNEVYDQGRILLQKKVTIEKNETAETLAKKIHELEHAWYSKVIETLLQ